MVARLDELTSPLHLDVEGAGRVGRSPVELNLLTRTVHGVGSGQVEAFIVVQRDFIATARGISARVVTGTAVVIVQDLQHFLPPVSTAHVPLVVVAGCLVDLNAHVVVQFRNYSIGDATTINAAVICLTLGCGTEVVREAHILVYTLEEETANGHTEPHHHKNECRDIVKTPVPYVAVVAVLEVGEVLVPRRPGLLWCILGGFLGKTVALSVVNGIHCSRHKIRLNTFPSALKVKRTEWERIRGEKKYEFWKKGY
ncbi:hypothetical protein AGDE_12620 [Angomonas deanei]|uniref:Uncharacterized protein n=1 Tax=Angomonas deanei TaxID=59799 RepID=A0A7G2C7Q3_9TRYP|nr:hypothetical protein AGDE_12620 [Angomonas deanei]CAD2215061.1 hypothetical protein, conserved [Angomonas deanei]|eukprot:EPY23940.1 hypothetical protein AGDE_12620 [Angomonas deanei]